MLFHEQIQYIEAQIETLNSRREVLVQNSEKGSQILNDLANLLDALQLQPEAINTLESEVLQMFQVAKDPKVAEEVAESEVAEPEVAEPEVAESEVAKSEVAESEVAESEVAKSDQIGATINPAIFIQGDKLLFCNKSKNRLNCWRDWLNKNKDKGQCELTLVEESGWDLHSISGYKWYFTFECNNDHKFQRFLLAEYKQSKMPPKNVEFASAA